MRTLFLLTLLALAAFCLSDLTDAKPSGPESDKAFMSKQEDSKVVNRLRRFLGGPAPGVDPLEPSREVCELIPTCDELSEQVGLQEAYKRSFGVTI
ncbi:osteocalcin [Mastomys coucha]|uniref:osteocalcin n=1 Tax=Mastomys coucha TaxID=35658 RepID=UPI0012625670|nr:osteocalcin [Mastomys coucha]